MPFKVLLTNAAVQDIEDIHRYIADHDSRQKAENARARIETAILSLADHPERGARPKELAAIGLSEYRQIFFKPYRVIYAVRADAVYVYLVADGRRDMRALLLLRLWDA